MAAVLQNFQHAIDATTTALNSEGSAMQENEAYMSSLEARTNSIKALFQELSTTIISSDLVGGLLDMAGAFLQMANTPIGGFVTKVGLLTTALSGLYGMLKAGILSEGVLGIALPALGTIAPYIAGITAGVIALHEAIDLVKEAVQEKIEAKVFDNVASEIEESERKIREYDELINQSKERLSELQQIPWGERTPEIDFEIGKLQDLIKEYERLREEEQRQLQEAELKKLRKTEFESGYKMVGISDVNQLDLESRFKGFLDVYNNAQQGYYKTIEEAALAFGNVMQISKADFADLGEYSEYVMAVLEGKGVFLQRTFHSFGEELTENTQEMSDYITSLGKLSQSDKEVVSSTQELIDKNKSYYDTLSIVKKYGGELNSEERQFVEQYEQLQSVLSQVTVGMDKLGEARDRVNAANKEARRSGDTLSLEDYVSTLKSVEGIDSTNLENVLGYLKNIGALDLDYTKADLEEIISQFDSMESKDVEITASVDTDESSFAEAEEMVDELNSEGITITSTSDADALVESLNQIKTLVSELSVMTVNVKVNSTTTTAYNALRNVATIASTIPSSKVVWVYAIDNASDTLNSIIDKLNQIKDKTVTVTVVQQTIGGLANGTNSFEGGKVLINDGEAVNGSAAELVVADGEASIYNDGKPVVVDLPKGAKVYTASQTQEILKNINDLKNQIPALADGNVTVPAETNASNIVYDPSEYYEPTTPTTIKPNNLESFKKWLKERKHLLELDEITQEQYYLDLEEMNEQYLKNNKNAQDDYWQYQEEVYKWKKKQLEEENELLKKQVELEKALGELAKAKSQKILVFKDGRFQYLSNVDAISEAQRNVEQVKTGYAGGTTNATEGLHLVGENGPELRVLKSGDGVIPNNLTKNLMDIAKMGTGWVKDIANKTKEVLYSFNINNLNLPNVTDTDNFLDGLKNYAYQYSYS